MSTRIVFRPTSEGSPNFLSKPFPTPLERGLEANLSVFLIPARTDTRWFHDIVLPKAKEIRFIRGRLKFGEATNSAPFPSMVVVFERKGEL